MSDTGNLKRKLRARKAPEEPIDFAKGLSTGFTPLNLALTGRTAVGLLPGHMYHLVGDSDSGKTFMAMSIFAEAANNPVYDGYRLIFNNSEDGMLMDVGRMFGPKLAKRLEHRRPATGAPLVLEELYYQLDDDLETPCVVVQDSMDALEAEADQKKFDQSKAAHRKGKEDAGSFGMAKAKRNSSGLRAVVNKLARNGSIMLTISQAKEKVGGFGFDTKTYAGGLALKFYATTQLWTSPRDKIRTRVAGKDRIQGVRVRVQVKKNRMTGRPKSVEVPIYWSAGVDDTGGTIDWLVEEGQWATVGKDEKKIITAPDFDFEGTREELVQKIESEGREKELRLLLAERWNEIEAACEVKRKPRYE